MPHPYDRTTYDDNVVDWITRAALEDAATRLYGRADALTVTQGSYNAGGVSASAGTHDGGGVVDLIANDHRRKVRELRRLGFAAWYRPTIPNVWDEHIHAVLIGNRKLSPAAKRQVLAYLAGKNGLANNGPDTGPRDFVDHRYEWQRGARRIERAERLIERARLLLATGIRGYAVAKSRRKLREAERDLPRTTDKRK